MNSLDIAPYWIQMARPLVSLRGSSLLQTGISAFTPSFATSTCGTTRSTRKSPRAHSVGTAIGTI